MGTLSTETWAVPRPARRCVLTATVRSVWRKPDRPGNDTVLGRQHGHMFCRTRPPSGFKFRKLTPDQYMTPKFPSSTTPDFHSV
jgi:hypothetical protein